MILIFERLHLKTYHQIIDLEKEKEKLKTNTYS